VEPLAQFAANVRAERTKRHLSQMELAERSGLHFTAISLLERGEREPKLTTILKVAEGLGLPPSRLLKGVE
jgi:transcriptional regulator with XRE-family HTH domain